MLPLMSTPFLEAAPMPEKKLIGTEITRAHGQEITRKVQALLTPSDQVWPKNRGGITARSMAPITTRGV